jgi:hypothetical protein
MSRPLNSIYYSEISSGTLLIGRQLADPIVTLKLMSGAILQDLWASRALLKLTTPLNLGSFSLLLFSMNGPGGLVV